MAVKCQQRTFNASLYRKSGAQRESLFDGSELQPNARETVNLGSGKLDFTGRNVGAKLKAHRLG